MFMNAYEVLGVRSNASQQEIKEAYIRHVKELHPDKLQNNPLRHLAEDRLKEINAAYAFLTGKAQSFTSNRKKPEESPHGDGSSEYQTEASLNDEEIRRRRYETRKAEEAARRQAQAEEEARQAEVNRWLFYELEKQVAKQKKKERIEKIRDAIVFIFVILSPLWGRLLFFGICSLFW